MKRISILLFLLFSIISIAKAQEDFPSKPIGQVNDFAGLLNRSEVQRLETKLRNYRDTTTNVIAIATLPDLKGHSIEEAATQLFNNWKMWYKDRYNGVLILIAPKEHQMRIEVGYGLEGAIPDVMAGRIIREILTPHFRQGDFYGGLDQATSALISLASGEYEPDELSQQTTSNQLLSPDFIIFLLFLIFVVFISSRGGGGRGGGRRRRRRSLGPGGIIWLGGGFGGFGRGGGFGGGGGGFGGFGGGGGFGSGGGGASGGW